MFLFKSKKPIEPEKQASQVNEDLELVTKMNQEFAVSLDLNDTLKTALQVIIARLNAEAANIFLINEKKQKFENSLLKMHSNKSVAALIIFALIVNMQPIEGLQRLNCLLQ